MISAGAGMTAISPVNEAAFKASIDADPHIPLTAYQEQMLAEKVDDTTSRLGLDSRDDVATGVASLGVDLMNAGAITVNVPESVILIGNQTPQARSYWCGPAAVHEALGQLGIAVSQSTLATKLVPLRAVPPGRADRPRPVIRCRTSLTATRCRNTVSIFPITFPRMFRLR